MIVVMDIVNVIAAIVVVFVGAMLFDIIFFVADKPTLTLWLLSSLKTLK